MEITVVANVSPDGQTVKFTSDQTDRWANVERADYPILAVQYSDGREEEGEENPGTWHRRAYEWVRYGQ